MEPLLLSTVTPVYKGAEYLDQLISELTRVRARLEDSAVPLVLAEAIFVDDSSIDGSAKVLKDLAARHKWIKVVSLSRNFGQHSATVAGILYSSGDWVATLDEDLQHRPSQIVSLLARAVEDSRDLVYAHPTSAVHGNVFRDQSSRLYKSFISLLTGNPHIRIFNSFRIIRGSVARAAASVASSETYLDMALCWFTDRIASVPLELKEVRGSQDHSGYNFRSLLRHARRMVISSQIKPLRIGGLIGIFSLILSVATGATLAALKILKPELIEIRGWTSLIVSTFFFGGLLSLLLGIALEFLSDLHLQALGKPNFFVVDRSADEILFQSLRDKA